MEAAKVAANQPKSDGQSASASSAAPAASSSPPTATPCATAAAGAAALDKARARTQEIADTLTALAGISDPTIAAARTALEAEQTSLRELLRVRRPLRTQLRQATAVLQKGLATITSLQTELNQLETLVDDRRRSLEDTQRSTLQAQATVHRLTLQLREEEAQRIVTCAQRPTPGTSSAPASASIPGAASALGIPTPGAALTLLDWAKGFLEAAPPAVALDFQHFIALQQQKVAQATLAPA